jgi:hypothetical protein
VPTSMPAESLAASRIMSGRKTFAERPVAKEKGPVEGPAGPSNDLNCTRC